jgi:phosphoglycerate dehydrogenase-like enzyme
MLTIVAKDLTIGICHPAYQIEPVVRERLPEVMVFQEFNTSSLKPRIREVDVLVISGAWHETLLKDAGRLKWIQSIGVGFNQFPLEELKRRGIRLTNAVGVNANAVSEHAIALILAFSRRLLEARDNQRRKHWRPMISDPSAREDELSGKTLGIVGLGTIGNGLATFGKALGMRVIGTKGNPGTYSGAADEVLPVDRIDMVLENSDFVVLCCPLKPETTNLIGAAQLKRMRRTSYLINVARGAVVVEADLISALHRGEIAGAALDVAASEPLKPDSQLWDMANVLITPHTGGETSKYERRLVDIIVENVRRWERGEPFIHQII